MAGQPHQLGRRGEGYLGNGWTPDWDDVTGHLVQVPADELQWLGAHNAVDQVNAVQQRWHCRSKGAKVVCQSLQSQKTISVWASHIATISPHNCETKMCAMNLAIQLAVKQPTPAAKARCSVAAVQQTGDAERCR